MTASSLSVIIPTFNAPPARLRRAIDSALACGAHVIIVDDGSAAPPAVDPPVHLIRRANGGPAAARNTGLDAAEGDEVVFLDDDDELLPAGVAAMRALAGTLGAVAAVAAREEHRASSVSVKHVPPEWADRAIPRPADVFRPLAIFGASGVLLRGEGRTLRFDEALLLGEDRDLLRRAAAVGPLAISSVPALAVTLHPPGGGNLSARAHFERRIADHRAVLERWIDADSITHFADATRWLVNAASKSAVSDEAWLSLLALCREHGWRAPLKSRLRRAFRRAAQR